MPGCANAELSIDRRRTIRSLSSIWRPSTRISRPRRPATRRPTAAQAQLGPRLGIVGRVTDKTVVRTGLDGLDRWRDHDAVHDAGVPFLQTVSQRTLDNVAPAFVLAGPASADSVDGDRRSRAGRVRRGSRAGLGLRPAVEHVASARARRRTSPWRWPTRVENYPCRPSRYEPESAVVDQLAEGASLLQRVSESVLRLDPASSSLGDPTIPRAQLRKPYPRYTTVSLLRQQRRHDDLSRFLHEAEQRSSGGLSYVVSYTRSKLETTPRRCSTHRFSRVRSPASR